ncbi:hypothetical protein KDA_56950 [Dictyobacter alpinus]|uniref:Uncharacterized protein n=1 Tax=Dictyobacter alpinus TaxID=2014873 RepID=A0A402BFL4_9CHLR|nr:hypothetical protein [Dictyobacter alpinus]GCE30211.1 hypothetical protein KDA_56950 [Dictyobacter alpinus]
MENRYYVQCLSPQIFLVRERAAADQDPSANDRLVKSFDVRHDAYLYVNTFNEEHKSLPDSKLIENG